MDSNELKKYDCIPPLQVEQWFRRKIQKHKSMKTCPQCSTGYPDSHTTCPIHGVQLNEIRDLRPGMVIRRSYRIIRKLGQGGMGAVYLAQHILMDEPRALKFLSPELSRDQAFTSRFLREVRTLRQIRNRNVVDCGDLEAAEDDSLFFSMEFVDGPDLRDFLRDYHPDQAAEPWVPQVPILGPGIPQSSTRGFVSGHDFSRAEMPLINEWALAPAGGGDTEGGGSFNPRIMLTDSTRALAPEGALPVPLALSIARQIAEGLGAAHAKGMVHRDIKPENILMARDAAAWLPKIADFGIVATKESSTAYTRTGGTLLTMAYAAPEQWRGTPATELDGRTDLYALGGLLYEMLTGQTPFHAENYEGWSRQHQTTPPQPPSTLRPDLANWQGLDAFVLRLLAKNREDRPKDVAELLALLDAVQRGFHASRPATIVESLPKPVATLSRLGFMKWAVAAILIVIALGIWIIVRFSHSTVPASTEGTQTLVQPSSVSTSTATKPSRPVSTLSTPAPGGGIQPVVQPGTIPNPTSNVATLLVLCDLACDWRLDGNSLGRLAAGDSVTVPLSLGRHLVNAITLDDLDEVKKEIEIKTPGQMNVHLALQSVQAARIKAAQEARDKAAREQQEREQRERVVRELAAEAWTDPATGLMWTKKDNGSDVTWQQASDYCRNLQQAGYSGWRLPLIDELAGIYDANANIYHVKGSLQLSNESQWSSSQVADSADMWNFNFGDGGRNSNYLGMRGSFHALCVRRSGE
jgi:serine/threonine protein kinase